MSLAKLQTATKILASFAILLSIIVLIAGVSAWRMHSAKIITSDLVRALATPAPWGRLTERRQVREVRPR
jgi:hypothetical protein